MQQDNFVQIEMKQNILYCIAGYVHKLKHKIKCVTCVSAVLSDNHPVVSYQLPVPFHYKIELQKIYLTLIVVACCFPVMEIITAKAVKIIQLMVLKGEWKIMKGQRLLDRMVMAAAHHLNKLQTLPISRAAR
jgi:hypothetical protein